VTVKWLECRLIVAMTMSEKDLSKRDVCTKLIPIPLLAKRAIERGDHAKSEMTAL
jgi:hypothetical protein